MINASEREKVKTKLGSQCLGAIQQALSEKGIVNRKSTPFSKSSISMILNGSREDPAVEFVIKSFINEKPEAGTPGLV